jgi:hypothetical protein
MVNDQHAQQVHSCHQLCVVWGVRRSHFIMHPGDALPQSKNNVYSPQAADQSMSRELLPTGLRTNTQVRKQDFNDTALIFLLALAVGTEVTGLAIDVLTAIHILSTNDDIEMEMRARTVACGPNNANLVTLLHHLALLNTCPGHVSILCDGSIWGFNGHHVGKTSA